MLSGNDLHVARISHASRLEIRRFKICTHRYHPGVELVSRGLFCQNIIIKLQYEFATRLQMPGRM